MEASQLSTPTYSVSADTGPCRCGAGCDRPPSTTLARLIHDARFGFAIAARRSIAGFACPLCLRLLPDRCATFAHYPARAAGGRRKTLLCKRCNSFLGTTYEPHAVVMAARAASGEVAGYEIEGFVIRPQGGPRIRQTARVRLDQETGTYQFEVLPRRSRDRDIDAQLEQMRGRLDNPVIEFPLMDSEGARLGVLSWGYLALFALFGYPFVFSRGIAKLRRVLLQATSEYLGRSVVLGIGDGPRPFGPAEPVLLLHDIGSDDRRPVAGPFAIGAKMGQHITVFPLADDTNAQVYEQLDGWSTAGGDLRHVIADMPWSEAFDAPAAAPTGLVQLREWEWTGSDPATYLIRSKQALVYPEVSAPVQIGQLESVGPLHNWRDLIRRLPDAVDARRWPIVVAETLVDRGLGQPNVSILEAAAAERDADIARTRLESALSPVAAAHALDMFRIWLLNTDVRSFDDIEPANIQDVFASLVRRLTQQRVVGGEFTEDARGPMASGKAAVLVWPGGQVVVGEFYTRATLYAAAKEAVTQALRA